jgi:three-Cys-motif partner protein
MSVPFGEGKGSGPGDVPTDKFFKSKQAAAVLKHGLLRRYVHMFAQKTGSTAPKHRVVYVDGYAGPGSYDDGSEGSPAIAVATARQIAAGRYLEGILVEKDDESCEALAEFIQGEQPTWHVFHGDVEDYVDEILDIAGDAPMFAFFDPFGLALSFDSVVRFRCRSPATQWGRHAKATEVLLNVSLPALRRVPGHLTASSTNQRYRKSRKTIIDKVDGTLGGDWWHDIWIDDPPDRDEQIVDEYVRRLSKEGGFGQGWYRAPVADRWGGAPSYHLCLFTQHPDGLWLFNDALSNSQEEYRQFCFKQTGQLDVEDRSPEWVKRIAANMEKLLQDRGGFRSGDHIKTVYGDTLGFARSKHIRAAIDDLYKRGKTSTNPKGEKRYDTLLVLPPKRK